MLVTLGRRAPKEDLFELLLDCHQRIRMFSRLAVDLGVREGLDEAIVVEAAQRCERYFTQALPLHVQDEEQSLLPRLRSRRPDLDTLVGSLRQQHEAHDALVAALLASLRAVLERPGDRERRTSLHEIASRLHDEFERHLALEEQTLFPVAREALTPQEQQAIREELRARRSTSGASSGTASPG